MGWGAWAGFDLEVAGVAVAEAADEDVVVVVVVEVVKVEPIRPLRYCVGGLGEVADETDDES